MMRLTTFAPVSGRSHSLTSFGDPSRATCSVRTTTRGVPATRSIAPPMPLTIFPGIIQLARSPHSETCMAPSTAIFTWPPRIMPKLVAESNTAAPGTSVTVCLPALIRSASSSPS